MTLLWIALLFGVCGLGLIVAARRRYAGGVELGSMSNAWIAEQRAGEQSYYER
jgi:hypothetical protein